VNSIDDCRKCDPTTAMCLGVKHDFGMQDILLPGITQVGSGQFIKILFMAQNPGPGIVNIQKILKIAETVGLLQLLDIPVLGLHTIALGQIKQHGGLQCSLDMNMQLGFWEFADERLHRGIE